MFLLILIQIYNNIFNLYNKKVEMFNKNNFCVVCSLYISKNNNIYE